MGAGRAAPWGKAVPATFGVPCALRGPSIHALLEEHRTPPRPSRLLHGESTAPPFGDSSIHVPVGKALRACALWDSLCSLGVPPSIPPPGKSRVPPRREPRRGGCAEGLQLLPPARMAAPLGGGRRCGKLVGSSKNVPLRLREMGLGPSWCLPRKSLGVEEVLKARQGWRGAGGQAGSVLGKHLSGTNSPERGRCPSSFP